MLKYALMAVAAATVVAVVFVMLPTGGGQRPEPKILSSSDTAPSTDFVIHPAAPPDPTAPAVPATPPVTPGAGASAGDLDAVMQRLRAAQAKPDATAAAQPPGAQTPAVPTPPGQTPPATTPPATSPADALAAATPPGRWSSVTAQGTRWRMAKSASGYTVSIDLGNGQVADVHVQPAFGNLDPASINVRVDYLRTTILQNFSNQSAAYSFARDGSVSVEP